MSRPGIGGTAAVLPAAMTMRRAVSRRPSTISASGATKRASPRSTVAPSARNRASESVGAMAAITPCTCSRTAFQSISGSGRRMPKRAAAARRLGGMRGGEQRLARHAAEVQAVAAHPVALDQRHAQAELRGDRGHGQAGRAGADHRQVEIRHRSASSGARRPAAGTARRARPAAPGCAARRSPRDRACHPPTARRRGRHRWRHR